MYVVLDAPVAVVGGFRFQYRIIALQERVTLIVADLQLHRILQFAAQVQIPGHIGRGVGAAHMIQLIPVLQIL
ncbi:hypothetical protein D3C75_1159160 [compost metagenome]